MLKGILNIEPLYIDNISTQNLCTLNSDFSKKKCNMLLNINLILTN